MEAQSAGVSKPRSLALEKMETLVRQMQSTDSGVPVRCQKLFLTTIPSAFMGYDLIEWLMENLPIDDSAEALHLASLLCQHGYFFPVGDAKTLQVKDDSSLYRFQTPYYWPSRNHVPDSTDYAIYLHKKIAKNKQKHGLEDCELEGYNQLKKTLASKWDFVTMQADEQLKMAKDRKKGDKIVSESQERAYWRVYRPPPGFTNSLEMPPVPDRSRPPPGAGGSAAALRVELNFLHLSLGRLRIKISQVAESTLTHHETYLELDPFLSPVQPSNPWLTDDPTFMELNEPLVEFPTERRVRRWAISMEETVSDPTGLHEFTACMRKEFSHENIRFWSAVHQLRKMPLSQVADEVRSIYDEFLRPGAPCEINIDGKTMERTQELLKNPTRFTYDYAADHIFDLLLKKDCYPRFLRSEHYKNLLTNATNPTSKKRFFTFGAPGKKKISSVTPPNISQLVASSGRLSSEDQSAVATTAGGGGVKPDCDPPYRKEADAGIFLGGPATPPPSARSALSPSPSPCPTRQGSEGSTGTASSALVPVPTAGSAVVPYTPAAHSPVPCVAAPASTTTATSVASGPTSVTASSSTPSTLVASSTAVSAVATSTPSSAPSSVAASAVHKPITESTSLPASSKDTSQISGSEAAGGGSRIVTSSVTPAIAAAGSGASAGKVNAAGQATGPATGSAEAAKEPGAGSAVTSSPTSAASAVTSTSVSEVEAEVLAVPPVEVPIGAVTPAEAKEAPEGNSTKEPLLGAPGSFEDAENLSGRGQSVTPSGTELQRSTAAGDLPRTDQVTTAISTAPLCPPPPTATDTSADATAAWATAIAPPAMFQDMAAPLATIDERDEPSPPPAPPLSAQKPSATAGSPPSESALASDVTSMALAGAAVAGGGDKVEATRRAGGTEGAVAGSGSASAVAAASAAPHTEIVTLTDRCAQTVETGDSVDYASTTDKQCEANLPRERGTRRKEKRVKICDAPVVAIGGAAASTAVSTAGGEAAAASDDAAKRRSRSASAESKRERKESRARREPRKKSSSERRRARLEDGELEPTPKQGASPKQSASPKRGDVVAPAAGEPAPQKLDESSVCPWENDKPEAARRVVVRWLDVQTDI